MRNVSAVDNTYLGKIDSTRSVNFDTLNTYTSRQDENVEESYN